MNPVKLIVITAAASTVMMMLGLVLMVTLVAGSVGAGATSGVLSIGASDEAITDIPDIMLRAYIAAAAQCDGLPWPIIAGIGKVESDHGRYGGATINADGTIDPPIIGIRLDGTNNTAVIRDTDGGVIDGDTVYDRAVGPFQFIPSSWAIFGADGNGDGIRDPHNIHDAIPAAVNHLCPTGSIADIEAAIFDYNRSSDYVTKVLDWATRYTGAVSTVSIDGYSLPVPTMSASQASRPHHNYPAFDIGTPVGTPALAMVDGTVDLAINNAGIYQGGASGKCGNTVIISGVDNVRYTYCHLSTVAASIGQSVTAGQQIGRTGGRAGTAGAGNTTGAHLHLSMSAQGRRLCPQPLLLSIIDKTPINALSVPSSGCITGRRTIDWRAWLSTST